MPTYVFRCENGGCLLNLPDGDERLGRVRDALGAVRHGGEGDGSVDVSFPSYAAMRAAEAAGEPRCSVCKGALRRRPTAPGVGTTRDTTPAKKRLDCAVGASADFQWSTVMDDRRRFGGDAASAGRIEKFKKDDAEAKEQAAAMVRDRKLVPRRKAT
jgi:hypothetical protein